MIFHFFPHRQEVFSCDDESVVRSTVQLQLHSWLFKSCTNLIIIKQKKKKKTHEQGCTERVPAASVEWDPGATLIST